METIQWTDLVNCRWEGRGRQFIEGTLLQSGQELFKRHAVEFVRPSVMRTKPYGL